MSNLAICTLLHFESKFEQNYFCNPPFNQHNYFIIFISLKKLPMLISNIYTCRHLTVLQLIGISGSLSISNCAQKFKYLRYLGGKRIQTSPNLHKSYFLNSFGNQCTKNIKICNHLFIPAPPDIKTITTSTL